MLAFLIFLGCSAVSRAEESQKQGSPEVWPVTIRALNEVAAPFPSVVIEVNGKRVGVTDKNGQLPIKLPVGQHKVMAFIPGFQRGEKTFTISAPQTRGLVEVQLNTSDVELRVSPTRQGLVLPADFREFAIQLFDRRGQELKVADTNWLQLVDHYSGESYDIASYLLIQPNGSLRADAPAIAALRKVFAKPRAVLKLRMSVELEDFEKRHVELERWLVIGRYRLQGRIIPPTYKRDLATGNLVLRAHYRGIEPLTGVDFSFRVATNKQGQFALRNLPFGYLHLEAEGGSERSANHDWQWRVKVFGDTVVTLMPQSVAELKRAIPAIGYRRQNFDDRFVTAGEPQPYTGL